MSVWPMAISSAFVIVSMTTVWNPSSARDWSTARRSAKVSISPARQTSNSCVPCSTSRNTGFGASAARLDLPMPPGP